MKSSVYRIVLAWAALACAAFAAPQPTLVPRPGQWTLGVKYEHLQQITLQRGTQGTFERFWYTIITITNNTGQDASFYPQCDLMTDTFQIIPAGRNVPPAVFEQIKGIYQGKYPFLMPLEKAGNRILQGEDNALDLAIIWPDFDSQATAVKVFITGLSNEIAVVDHPIEKDQAGQPSKVYLRKTLELSYNLMGDPALRPYLRASYEGQRWIMR